MRASQVVDALALLHAASVVHFDLKLQNVFLEPLPGTADADFWLPPTEQPPFRAVLGDFGESKMWLGGLHDAEGAHTARPRGTDFMKSPEMLANGHMVLQKGRENFDRRKHSGAGMPSDMWSLGCLLYQLVFGEMLFFDPDYMRFLQRLTFGGDAMPPSAAANLEAVPVVQRLVQQLILHDPAKRQTIEKVQGKLVHLQHASRLDGEAAHLPVHQMPPVAAVQQAAAAAAAATAPDIPVEVGAAPRESAAMAKAHLPCSWSAVPEAAEAAAAAAPPPEAGSAERILQVCPGVLLAPEAACSARTLATDVPRCLIVACHPRGDMPHSSLRAPAGNGSRSKERWLRLAAILDAPCIFVKHLDVRNRQGSAHVLRQVTERVCNFDPVLVVYEGGLWQEGAMVAMAMATSLHALPMPLAAARIRRCSALGDVPLQGIDVVQAAVC